MAAALGIMNYAQVANQVKMTRKKVSKNINAEANGNK